MELEEVVEDVADALVQIDTSGLVHKSFQPGVGPFSESVAVRNAIAHLKQSKPEKYGHAVIKRTPDVLIRDLWALEFKIVRPFGDNGRAAEHWSENLLHPYSGNTSLLGDCLKLRERDFGTRKAVVVLAFEHSPPRIDLGILIRCFEMLASKILNLRLGPRVEVVKTGLRHPVHQQLRVVGFEILRSN